MSFRASLDRTRWFVFNHLEHLLAVCLVVSLVLIHAYIDYKLAFLSFYYLPIIFTGFYLGRRFAVTAAVFTVSLVIFFQAFGSLAADPGLHSRAWLTIIPWGGFLILTAYVVGLLTEQRQGQQDDLQSAYLAILDLLTIHLEADGRQHRGHSHRVAEVSAKLGQALGLHPHELSDLRVAALLHEVGPHDPRLLRLLMQLPNAPDSVPIARTMRGACDLLDEYSRYYDVVQEDWPVDAAIFATSVKILAVADAYETLQTPTTDQPGLAPWSALEEMEKGAGRTFATDVVRALRRITTVPQRKVRTSDLVRMAS